MPTARLRCGLLFFKIEEKEAASEACCPHTESSCSGTTTNSKGNKPNFYNCPEQTLKKAKGLRKQSNGIPAAECMIYVCFGSPGFAGQETFHS